MSIPLVNTLQQAVIVSPNNLLASLCQFALESLGVKVQHHMHWATVPTSSIFDVALIDVDPEGSSMLSLPAWVQMLPKIALVQWQEAEKRWHLLEQGFHDYLLCPFSVEEMAGRLKGLEPRSKLQPCRLGDWIFDPEAHELRSLRGDVVRLAPIEQAVMQMLVQSQGRACGSGTLVDRLQSEGMQCQPNTVPVVISKLRKRIESNPAEPQLLVTIKGQGYQLNVQR